MTEHKADRNTPKSSFSELTVKQFCRIVWVAIGLIIVSIVTSLLLN